MAASGQYPNELPEVLEFAVGDEIIGIRGGVLFRTLASTLPEGAAPVTVVDTLTSTSTTDALSASRGKVLQDTKAPINSPTFTGVPRAPTPLTAENSTQIATMAAVHAVAGTTLTSAKSYADTLVAGLLDDRGNYNPTATSAYPTAANNGSGTEGAILKGDLWAISADGTMGGLAVTVGDTVRALVDSPAQTASNWAITQNNLTYVPENSANKSTDTSMNGDTGTYPDSPTVKTFVENSVAASLQARVSEKTASYDLTTDQAANNDGKTYLRMNVSSDNTVTIPSTQTKPISIRQAGEGTTTLVAGSGVTLNGTGVTLNGTLAFTAQHQTKTVIPLGGNIFDVVG